MTSIYIQKFPISNDFPNTIYKRKLLNIDVVFAIEYFISLQEKKFYINSFFSFFNRKNNIINLKP